MTTLSKEESSFLFRSEKFREDIKAYINGDYSRLPSIDDMTSKHENEDWLVGSYFGDSTEELRNNLQNAFDIFLSRVLKSFDDSNIQQQINHLRTFAVYIQTVYSYSNYVPQSNNLHICKMMQSILDRRRHMKILRKIICVLAILQFVILLAYFLL